MTEKKRLQYTVLLAMMGHLHNGLSLAVIHVHGMASQLYHIANSTFAARHATLCSLLCLHKLSEKILFTDYQGKWQYCNIGCWLTPLALLGRVLILIVKV